MKEQKSYWLIVIIIVFLTFVLSFILDDLQNKNSEVKNNVIKTEKTNQPFDAILTTTQIDKICITSLAEVNGNPISNYIKVSSNPSAKKYTYQSKETLYKYSCGFTGKDTFYVNGQGWQDIIPRGTIYKGDTENCVKFDLYDPAFKLTHNFTICD